MSLSSIILNVRAYIFKKLFFIMRPSRPGCKGEMPYYPVSTSEDKRKLALYQEEAKTLSNVIFGGRLGMYKYFDMHHVIGESLKLYGENKKAARSGPHFCVS